MIQAARDLTLGTLRLKGNVLLSPLESVSDVGFRQLCHRNGAALTFTEMIRAQGNFNYNIPNCML
jgi:tRNA-dihydrouridine synthase